MCSGHFSGIAPILCCFLLVSLSTEGVSTPDQGNRAHNSAIDVFLNHSLTSSHYIQHVFYAPQYGSYRPNTGILYANSTLGWPLVAACSADVGLATAIAGVDVEEALPAFFDNTVSPTSSVHTQETSSLHSTRNMKSSCRLLLRSLHSFSFYRRFLWAHNETAFPVGGFFSQCDIDGSNVVTSVQYADDNAYAGCVFMQTWDALCFVNCSLLTGK